MLYFILFVTIIVLLARDPTKTAKVKDKIYQINRQWMDYLAAQHTQRKSPEEQLVIRQMLDDLQSQGMPAPSTSVAESWHLPDEKPVVMSSEVEDSTKKASNEAWQIPRAAQEAALDVKHPDGVISLYDDSERILGIEPVETDKQLDNVSILLYFGAFLLAAAAGLFVAFGDISGVVKTFVIAVTTLAIYSLGFWLKYSRPALGQAANTFIGIGIIIAPLVGVAAYSYVFKNSPELVWFGTSILCLLMYGHAYWALKNTLMEYVLIGAFLSLFESAVSIISAPIYYYAWVLAAMGILLQVLQLVRGRDADESEPRDVSANILLPLSSAVSLWMAPTHGTMQLGVSLLLAAAYYGLSAWRLKDDEDKRELPSIAAQVFVLASIASLTYAATYSLTMIGLALLIAAIPQFVLVAFGSGKLLYNFAAVSLASLVLTMMVGWSESWLVVGAMLVFVLMSLILWLRHERLEGYYLASIALVLLPFVFGYRIVEGEAASKWAAGLILGVAGLQVLGLRLFKESAFALDGWRNAVRAMFLVTLGLLIIPLVSTGGLLPLYLIIAASALVLVMLLVDGNNDWAIISGAAFAVPLLQYMAEDAKWMVVVVIAAVWNAALVLWKKYEANRAFLTLSLLLAPLAVLRLVDNVPSEVFMALTYGALALVFMGFRFVVNRSSVDKINSTGISYSVGYWVAFLPSVVASSFGDAWLSVLVCLVLAVGFALTAIKVEKQPSMIFIVPLLLQAAIWLSYQPGQIVGFMLGSAALSLVGYLFMTMQKPAGEYAEYIEVIRMISLITMFGPLALYLDGSVVWPMPWIFLVASLSLLHYLWGKEQSSRELAGGAVLLSVWALMNFYGITNTQAYTHVLAAFFGVYAVWRSLRNDAAGSDNYLMLMLASATIPLVLQSLFGKAGDLYGWWLLIEQVVIMLAGMALGKKIMVRWGLYVALGSVLYQLRHLGWAALAVLAVFLIGLAVYRLQKTSTPSIEPSDEASRGDSDAPIVKTESSDDQQH